MISYNVLQKRIEDVSQTHKVTSSIYISYNLLLESSEHE